MIKTIQIIKDEINYKLKTEGITLKDIEKIIEINTLNKKTKEIMKISSEIRKWLDEKMNQKTLEEILKGDKKCKIEG